MKVTVSLTIDVDPDAWRDYLTGDETAAEVRADVKRHVLNMVQQSAAVDDLAIRSAALAR